MTVDGVAETVKTSARRKRVVELNDVYNNAVVETTYDLQ